jgi:hypothetical protein
VQLWWRYSSRIPSCFECDQRLFRRISQRTPSIRHHQLWSSKSFAWEQVRYRVNIVRLYSQPLGGNYGSVNIDQHFHEWMIKTFGRAYTDVPIYERGPGSKFMDCFGMTKRTFSTSQAQRAFHISPIAMSTDSDKYDEDGGIVVVA